METEKITSQERLCAEIQALAANHYEGMTNKELAALVGTSESNIFHGKPHTATSLTCQTRADCKKRMRF